MVTKIIAKMLGKKLYMSRVTIVGDIVGDNFVAEYYNNSLLKSLKWTLHGIHETTSTTKNASTVGGVFGQIHEFKILNITKSSISFCGYSKPKAEDTLFMTNQMVYIPQKILKTLKNQEVSVTELDILFK